MLEKKQIFDGNGEFARTERVHLTMLREEDKEHYLSNKITKYAIIKEELESFINILWATANGESVYTFCIWSNDTNEYMGFCNYNELDKDIPAIGIELIKSAQNKGIGYEVCRVLLKNYFAKTDLPYIRYEAMRSNERSRHLGEKLGGILKEIKPLSPSLIELNESLPEEERLDFSQFDVFTYEINRNICK